MIYVYAPELPEGTRELIEALKAKRLVRHDGLNFTNKGRVLEFTKDDAIICWGKHVPPVPNAVMLNSSYEYVDQLNLNKKLTNIANYKAEGMTAFELTEIAPTLYRRELEQHRAANWKFNGGTETGYVMLEEFENYGSRWYNFQRRGSAHVINGSVMISNCNKRMSASDLSVDHTNCSRLIKATGFDFGKVSYGIASSTFVAIKMLTAPALTKDAVTIYATHLQNLITLKQNQQSSATNMAELLGEL